MEQRTISNAFEDYLSGELNRSPLTVEAYMRDTEAFAKFLGTSCDAPMPTNASEAAESLAGATTSDVRAWLASMAQTMTPRTIRRKTQSVRALFHYFLTLGIIESNPAADVVLTKIPKPLPTFVRDSDMEHVLSPDTDGEQGSNISRRRHEAESIRIRDRLIVELLYATGMRRAEIITICNKDLTDTGELRITGKRNKQRVVPLAESTLALISEYRDARRKESGQTDDDESADAPLLTHKGGALTAGVVYTVVRKALAGVPAAKRSPHVLRHSFATAMLNNGASINTVKEFLGHSSLATTQIYTHVSYSELKRAYTGAHPRAKHGEEAPSNETSKKSVEKKK